MEHNHHILQQQVVGKCLQCPHYDHEYEMCGAPSTAELFSPPGVPLGGGYDFDTEGDGEGDPDDTCDATPSFSGTAPPRQRESLDYWCPPPGTWMPDIGETRMFAPIKPPPGLWIDRRYYGLKRRLASVLKDNAYLRKTPLKKSGTIDRPRLWKVRMDKSDVFRKKESIQGKDYACILCVDLSGSMQCGMTQRAQEFNGPAQSYYLYPRQDQIQPRDLNYEKLSRIEVATEISSQLAYMLDTISVPTTIIGYNHVVKVWREPVGKRESPHAVRNQMIASCVWDGGCNHDLTALIALEERLQQAAANGTTQPFAILMTDGHPAGCGNVMWRGQLTRVAHVGSCRAQWDHIRARYPAFALGIGIDVGHVYGGCRRVDTARQLNAQLLGAVQHVIRRTR